MKKINIYIGKGGVGKSTCSSLNAIKSVKEGNKTLLDSLDPAHNLHDIFEKSFSNKAQLYIDNLFIRESDIAQLGKQYIKSMQKQLKGLYHYQQALNIDRYFSVLKYAPGTEEYASLMALERCFSEDKYDKIFIDTPPTALTLKTLALPSVNLHWINSLINMREEIVKKKNTIKNIRKENLENIETDPVFQQLNKMKNRYEKLDKILRDDKIVEFNLVLNEDELSFSESLLIQREMNELKFNVHKVVVNKATDNNTFYQKIINSFPSSKIELVPLSNEKVTSVSSLEDFYGKISVLK
ncbi:MAG: ArsA family ATPase [Sphaerochaetaceae bacterium]|nr:ArsA family ATPase [Sphaerochaetaceae bacterium]